MKSAALSLVLATVFAAPAPAQQASDARTAQIYVSVLDSKGAAVPGLTVKDFTVREDGAAREVLKAEPATEAMEIMLLVDDSQAATTAIPHLRDGLTAFVTRMQGKAKIGIVTVGERPTSVVEYTDDLGALKKGINRIFARPGGGAYLLEAIREVTRGMQKRETTARRVIIALTTEGVEFSNVQHDRVLADLRASGAQFHVLAIGSPAGSTSDEMRNRNMVLAEGTKESGGRRDQLLSPMAIIERLNQVAGELLNQYVVTYGRPDRLIPPEKIAVGTTRTDLTVRARTRVIGK